MERSGYDQAAQLLPVRLRKLALALPAERRDRAEEFRLRAGQPFTVLTEGREEPLDAIVEQEELEMLVDIATGFSRYAAAETMREGYLAVEGGFRVGLCGTVVMKEGRPAGLRQISSAAVRICRRQLGVAAPVAAELYPEGVFYNTLIVSPPGGGKTTLLRDLVRCLSKGEATGAPLRVALLDERGEVAACCRGEPQMDVGSHTDVIDACPKALAIPMALRAMNPQVIAVDEITQREDLAAMLQTVGCGVGLLATAHASDAEELTRRPLYRELLEEHLFDRLVSIRVEDGRRTYRVESL